MGVKQDILNYIDTLKQSQSQTTLYGINNVVQTANDPTTMEEAVESIKALLVTHDEKIQFIDEFAVDVGKIQDPEVPAE